jgi:hypothetical protein
MALWLKIVIGFFSLVILSGVMNGLGGNSNSTSSLSTSTADVTTTETKTIVDLRPEKQKEFESVIATFSQQFDKAQNELQESTCRRDRMNAIKSLNISPQIGGWIGTLIQLKTNTEGKAYITIRLNRDLSVSTWNNALSDFGDNTLIPMDTDLFKTLSNMKTGQKVKFSGSFIRSNMDYFREQSLTIRGAMKNPDFLMKFSSVEVIN